MSLVRMDIDALTGIVADLRRFGREVEDQRHLVNRAAAAALETTSLGGLDAHLPVLEDLARDQRIELATLMNSTGWSGGPATGIVTYTQHGSDDSIDAVRQAIGARLAAMATSDKAHTYGCEAEVLAPLDKRLAHYVNDPIVMAGFYDALPAGKLLDLMSGIGSNLDGDLRVSLLKHLKAGLHTADAHWDASTSAKYAAALVDGATAPPEMGSSDLSNRSPSVLTYLLNDSHYTTAFLSSAAQKIDTFDRSPSADRPKSWSGDGSNFVGYTGAVDGPGSRAWDPAAPRSPEAALMSALGNNPKASLDFFSQGAVAGGVSDRQMYWIHDRDWSLDHSLDGFNHLSKALLAATTDPSVLNPPDGGTAKQAAQLASQTVNLLGHRTDIEPSDPTGKSATAKNLATILSTYMHGVDSIDAVSDFSWDTGSASDLPMQYFDGEQVNTPKFNEASVKSFIALAASSRDGFTTLRAGVDTFADRKYSLALETLSANPTDATARRSFAKAYTSQAQVEGLFTRAVGSSAIAEAKGKDAASAMWVALGVDAVRVVPFGTFVTKAGGGELAKAVVTFTTNRGRDATAAAASARWGEATGTEIDTQQKVAERAQATAEARVLTALATYPKLLAEPLPDGDWSPGGQLQTVDEMGGFDSDLWREAKATLLSDYLGAGAYFDKEIFDKAYEGEFHDFYDNEK